MNQYWSRRIRDIVPYTPGEQPKDRKFIKLNTNECPYPPSPKALAAIREAAGESLRLYPDPECLDLRAAIARREGLDVDRRLLTRTGRWCFPELPTAFTRCTPTFSG